MFTTVPSLIKKCFPSRLWQVAGSGRKIFLTFDDGPIPEVTPWVLDQLRAYNAAATFFCIGDNIQKHPALFRRVLAEGHSAGNHTLNHLNGWKTSVDDYIANVLGAEKIITEFGNPNPSRLFRPPYGRLCGKQAQTLMANGYRIVMWDILSRDYDQNLPPETCLENILRYTKPGSILVFHDSLKAEKNLKQVLPQVLQHFSKKRFSFEKL